MKSHKKYERKFADFKAVINKLKDVPCADCGQKFPPCAMDYDHKVGEIKSFNVGTGYSYTIVNVIKEIDKCDVVCANCHRIRTYGGRN